MMREQIVLLLEEYRDTKFPATRTRLRSRLFFGISRTVWMRCGERAKRALYAVLTELLLVPAHFDLCLSAVLQLCRESDFGFTRDDDVELIRKLATGTYFRRLSAEEMVVETQEGVV